MPGLVAKLRGVPLASRHHRSGASSTASSWATPPGSSPRGFLGTRKSSAGHGSGDGRDEGTSGGAFATGDDAFARAVALRGERARAVVERRCGGGSGGAAWLLAPLHRGPHRLAPHAHLATLTRADSPCPLRRRGVGGQGADAGRGVVLLGARTRVACGAPAKGRAFRSCQSTRV